MKKKIKLVGHSGCRLELEDRNGNLVVLKTATDPDYSERLKKQHQKQKDFKTGAFYTPAVFNTHVDENGYFGFSMEYISGLTLAEHFEDAPIATIKAIAEKFLSIVPLSPSFDLSAKSLFTKKIKDLKNKLSPQEDENLARAFRMLQAYEWEHCAPSNCHGDMTLENIIYKNGELYLIDFLDSFYDSWMMDIAKLLFDLECLWSYRNVSSIDENLKTRLVIFKKIIIDSIHSKEKGPEIVKSIYYMALLHLLRILPYTKDEKTRRYLLLEMTALCDSIGLI